MKTMFELLLMRKVLRDRLINVVLGSGTSLVLVLLLALKSDFKNEHLNHILCLMKAFMVYIATKPLRKLTEMINELDNLIEGVEYHS